MKMRVAQSFIWALFVVPTHAYEFKDQPEFDDAEYASNSNVFLAQHEKRARQLPMIHYVNTYSTYPTQTVYHVPHPVYPTVKYDVVQPTIVQPTVVQNIPGTKLAQPPLYDLGDSIPTVDYVKRLKYMQNKGKIGNKLLVEVTKALKSNIKKTKLIKALITTLRNSRKSKSTMKRELKIMNKIEERRDKRSTNNFITQYDLQKEHELIERIKSMVKKGRAYTKGINWLAVVKKRLASKGAKFQKAYNKYVAKLKDKKEKKMLDYVTTQKSNARKLIDYIKTLKRLKKERKKLKWYIRVLQRTTKNKHLLLRIWKLKQATIPGRNFFEYPQCLPYCLPKDPLGRPLAAIGSVYKVSGKCYHAVKSRYSCVGCIGRPEIHPNHFRPLNTCPSETLLEYWYSMTAAKRSYWVGKWAEKAELFAKRLAARRARAWR